MDKKQVEAYRKAGKIAAEVVKFGKSMIKKDMLLLDVANKIEKKIVELGGDVAFPVNLSVNEIAAHYTPSINDARKAEGLLCIDLGVEIDGCIADTAFSLDLDGKHEEMIKLNEFALEETLKKIKPGIKIGEIGNSIHSIIDEYNEKHGKKYSIIKNLTGHSLGEDLIHAGLTIPNYKNESKIELKDIAIAVEPFLTEGVGEVIEGKKGEIFMLAGDGQARDSEARKILKFVKEKYRTKPFCKRWISDAGFKKVDFALAILSRQGILHNFPELVEKSRKPVSQWEHTVLISDKAEVITAQ